MHSIAFMLIAGAGLLATYTYLAYPLALRIFAGRAPAPGREGSTELPSGDEAEEGRSVGRKTFEGEWPMVSITIPVFNEETQMAKALEHLLRIDYPRDRLQILVVSDASTDGTDHVVRSFSDRGVELHRMPVRRGKTAAENAVAPLLRGAIVVNTDASIRIDPGALKPLVARLTDPAVGVASGRDISVPVGREESNSGESGYVGYEMWVRSLETRAGGIVGASGCLYAIRSELHRYTLPENLSRDFAAALVAREQGFRAVSEDRATCLVPRTASLRKEYRRKVRTMTRGIRTLLYKKGLLDPRTSGLFAWKLWSHKVCRWLVPWAMMGAVVGIALLAPESGLARSALAGIVLFTIAAGLGWFWPQTIPMPRVIALPAHLVWSNLAAIHAAILVPLGHNSAVWEPTRRKGSVRALRP